MPRNILYNASTDRYSTIHWGTILVSNIHYDTVKDDMGNDSDIGDEEDNSGVAIKTFLHLSFYSPAKVTGDNINPNPWVDPWVTFTTDVENEEINANTFYVSVKINLESPTTISNNVIIHIGVGGDLTQDSGRYLKSFTITADSVPDASGTVNINCEPCPDNLLVDQLQTVVFTMGSRVVISKVPLGRTSQQTLKTGTYTVTANQLATGAQTAIAKPQVKPSSLKVISGQPAQVNIIYDPVVDKYSTIDVGIGYIPKLSKERLYVRVVRSGQTLAKFWIGITQTTRLYRLPVSGTADISVDAITLNNITYSFDPQKKELYPGSGAISALFLLGSLNETTLPDVATFTKLPIILKKDDVSDSVSLKSKISVRLTSSSSPPIVYTKLVNVNAAAGTTEFDVPVAPGDYTVQATNFIESSTVYHAKAPAKLTVAHDGQTTLKLTLRRGANLRVRGFPGFLSFGGCADMTPGNQNDFVAARASSIFKYAGNDGWGDHDKFITENDDPTKKTIDLARRIEGELEKLSEKESQHMKKDRQVLAVMISYPCNLSGADVETTLHKEDDHMYGLGNLILSLGMAQSTKDSKHPVPAGYVINPDFLGECMKAKLPPDYGMSVRKPLQGALKHHNISANPPEYITNTLGGYVLAVNWLMRTVGKDCTFGWLINLWGVNVAGNKWIYEDGDVAVQARIAGNYLKSLGVFDSRNPPDFLAIDRYEADDFTSRSYFPGWCFGPREWARYFDFCEALSAYLQIPIMPWQIPSSRTPLKTDSVVKTTGLTRSGAGVNSGTGGGYTRINQGFKPRKQNNTPGTLEDKSSGVGGNSDAGVNPSYYIDRSRVFDNESSSSSKRYTRGNARAISSYQDNSPTISNDESDRLLHEVIRLLHEVVRLGKGGSLSNISSIGSAGISPSYYKDSPTTQDIKSVAINTPQDNELWGTNGSYSSNYDNDKSTTIDPPWKASNPNTSHDKEYWGTGGSYILGDPGINSNYHNAHPEILNLPIDCSKPYLGRTVEDIFVRAEPFDLTEPKYIDFPLRGIFTVLLGGGIATGIVSTIGNPEPWVRDKLRAYSEKRISLDGESQ